jgi:ClpP class serine protease
MTPSHPALARLAGRPLAIAPRALDGLLARAFMPDGRPTQARSRGYAMTEAGIAVVPVLGPLVTRGDWLTALLGATDYAEIGSTVEAAFADPSARAVLLELDSPGGEVGGLFDLVDRLATLRDAARKPLWAVASETALSAAFAIASVAERLYVTRTAEVGSVGVVAVHVDESIADAMAGQKWTLIHAGARKVDGNAHEPLSPAAFADIQEDVDALHSELVALVARNRRMTAEAVRAREAAIYRGRRGIEAGFADRLGSLDQALAELAQALDQPPASSLPRRQPAPFPQSARRKQEMTSSTLPETPDAPGPEGDTSGPDAPVVAPMAPIGPNPTPQVPPEATAEHLRAEYAEIAAVAAQAARLGVAIDVADAMARGVAPNALRRSVLDTLAARAEASTVVAAAPQLAAAGDSPIVRRARERASANRT